MPTQVQFRRGTTAQNNSFTGAVGEIVVNNTNQSIRVHDGTTQGGFEQAKADLSNHNGVGVLTATTFVGALTGTASSTTNIPNLTGAITSVNTTTSLGSFTSAQLATALTDETGSGSAVFATSPTLVTPVLGTPSSGTLTNCTSLPISGLTASTSTALGVGSIELGHATDTTISRVSAGVVAIEGVNIVTTSSTDTLTNKTLTSPTLTTPALGTPSSGTLTSCTGLPITGITSSTTIGLGVGSIELGHATDTTLARSAAGVVTIEGVEVVTLSRTQTLTNKTLTSPTLTTPALGTPSSGTLTSCTGLPLTTGVTGTLPVANGGTGVTASTGTGSVVLSASPTFTGTVGAAAITATGDIAAANFNSTSDISLKDNIQTIVNPLDKINKLNGVTFNWKENQKPSIGVIAQELEKVLPELVTQGDIKSVNYNGLIGVLIEAVKEQQKQIEELKSIIKNQ